MKWFKKNTLSICTLALLTSLSSNVWAQDDVEEVETEVAVEETEATAEEVSTQSADQTRIEELVNKRNEDSENGSTQWKPSYGVGIEASYFFTALDRWNAHLLEPNNTSQFDTNGVFNFDLALEASFLESTRLTLFGGIATPFHSDPSLLAYYVGLEPALAFRGGDWELAFGAGVALGMLTVQPGDAEADSTIVLVRPFLEVRRYFSEWMAGYVRGGFNQWYATDIESDDLALTRMDGRPLKSNDLHEGGVYVALGLRFGHYPTHIKHVPDSDGDGYYDDVDECPNEAEDFDGFEDEDGCPELDNDNDGVPDAEDQCPNIPGTAENNGCPASFDSDGDGIPDAEDKCLGEPENFTGFQDEDGCPELDRDNDGIPDTEDHCPDVSGVPEKQGCPFERVEVTLKNIVIHDVVNFEYNKAVIMPDSFQLLNEVASVIKHNDRIRKIEVQGHTDHAGSLKYNMTLSENRAKSVMQYLIDQGVDPERLTAKGYGPTQPLVPLAQGQKKESPEDAAKNRRVEFVILEQDEVRKVVREDQVPEDVEDVKEVKEEDSQQ